MILIHMAIIHVQPASGTTGVFMDVYQQIQLSGIARQMMMTMIMIMAMTMIMIMIHGITYRMVKSL